MMWFVLGVLTVIGALHTWNEWSMDQGEEECRRKCRPGKCKGHLL